MKDVSKLLKILKPYIPFMILSLLAALVAVGLQLYSPIVSGQAIDCVIGKGNVLSINLIKLLKKFIIIILLSIVFQWVVGMINNAVIYRVVRDLRTRIYKHINRLPVSYVDSHEYGDIISRTLNDVDRLSDGLLLGFSQLLTGIVTIIGTLFFMFRTSVVVAVVVVVLTPLSLLVAGFITKKTYNLFKIQSDKKADMTSLVNEMIGSEKTVQALSYETRAQKRFEAVNDELAESEFKATFFSSLTNPSTRLINNFVYAGVAIVVTLLAPEIIKILATAEYLEAVHIMPPIAAGIFMISLSNLYTNVLIYHKKTQYVMIATTIAAVVNVILNYFGIKVFGYMAAAYTTLIAYIIMAVFQCVVSNRVHTKTCPDDIDSVYDNGTILLAAFIAICVCMGCEFLYSNTVLRYVAVGCIVVCAIVFRKRIMALFTNNRKQEGIRHD